jgi:hypothetical protein
LTTLVFPDAVALVLPELTAGLPALGFAGIPVGNRVPSPRPERFIVVRRAGGARITIVTEAATLNLQAWSTSVPDADDLAQAARSIVWGMAGRTFASTPVYRVEDVEGPAEEADPLSDQPMAQLSVSVHVRGRVP